MTNLCAVLNAVLRDRPASQCAVLSDRPTAHSAVPNDQPTSHCAVLSERTQHLLQELADSPLWDPPSDLTLHVAEIIRPRRRFPVHIPQWYNAKLEGIHDSSGVMRWPLLDGPPPRSATAPRLVQNSTIVFPSQVPWTFGLPTKGQRVSHRPHARECHQRCFDRSGGPLLTATHRVVCPAGLLSAAPPAGACKPVVVGPGDCTLPGRGPCGSHLRGGQLGDGPQAAADG